MAETGAEKNGWGGRWERFGFYALALVMTLVVFIYRENMSAVRERVTFLEMRLQVVADLQRDKMHLVQQVEQMGKIEEMHRERLAKLEGDLRVLQTEMQLVKARTPERGHGPP